jgi:phage terminase large subunit-like protein
MTELSPIDVMLSEALETFGLAGAERAIRSAFAELTVLERVTFAHNWRGVWARPSQLPPAGDTYKSLGELGARGAGKTTRFANHVHTEIEAGRADLVGLCAQNEQTSIDVQVAALIAVAPPWFKPEWRASAMQLVYPNGARCYLRSPEAPGNIRGLQFSIAWLSEIQSWATSTGQEALNNFFVAARVPGTHVLWDATPKARNPLLMDLIAQSEAEPDVHVIRTSTMMDNTLSFDTGYVDRMIKRTPLNTAWGQAEILGKMPDEGDNTLFRAAWIAEYPEPRTYVRRVLGVDPAIAQPGHGRDQTGIIEAGLGDDSYVYIIGDDTARFSLPEEWADLLIRRYFDHGCDLIAIECNAGYSLIGPNIRAAGARAGGVRVETLKHDDPLPQYRAPATVYVREVYAARGQDKSTRAAPLSIAYSQGRVRHVAGADLRKLTDEMLTWDPSQKNTSPDRLDAAVWACSELLGFARDALPSRAAGFVGLEAANAALQGGRLPYVSGKEVHYKGLAIKYDGSSSLRNYRGFGRGNTI